jgi:hypothetical protein
MDLTPTTHVHAPARNRAALVAVVVSFGLAVAKLAVGAITGSVSVIASGLDSLLDVLASGVNAWAIHAAGAPPDAEHRFGHGKFESIAALAQAAFVGGSAVLVSLEAAQRFSSQNPVRQADLALITVGLSTLVTLALVAWQKHEVARTGSVAVAADRAHYTTDVLSGLGVMAAVYASAELGHCGGSTPSPACSSPRRCSGRARSSPAAHCRTCSTARCRPPTCADRGRARPVLPARPRVPRTANPQRRPQPFRRGPPRDSTGRRRSIRRIEVYCDVVTGAARTALPGVDLSIHLDPAGEPDPIDRK